MLKVKKYKETKKYQNKELSKNPKTDKSSWNQLILTEKPFIASERLKES